MSEDFTFSNMVAAGKGARGIDGGDEAISEGPAGRVFSTAEYMEQHRQSLAYWAMKDEQGTVLLHEANYARYGKDRQMEHTGRFWK